MAAGILGDRLGAVPLLNVQAICYLVGGVAALAGIADAGGSPRPDRPWIPDEQQWRQVLAVAADEPIRTTLLPIADVRQGTDSLPT